MAQRLSNEIIAQVLTDVVTKLDKSINNFRAEMSGIKQDLTAHREATQKVLSRRSGQSYCRKCRKRKRL